MRAERPELRVVTYHYVRDLPATPFPRIKGMLTCDFRRQVDALAERYEMATLESALALLDGSYQPTRDLCLLTFDDGLKDHYTDVLPVLAERGIQGLFFISTGCLEQAVVLPVHKNHFVMAALDPDEYARTVRRRAAEMAPDVPIDVDPELARRAYPWDTDAVGQTKYLLNFVLAAGPRERILDALFAEHLGDEAQFAEGLYMSWDESREMQSAGMLMGGHSHRHAALASLGPDGQRGDLAACTELLHHRLRAQPRWPFSYPFGWYGAYDDHTVELVRELGYTCAFTMDSGANEAGVDPFRIYRVDTNDALAARR